MPNSMSRPRPFSPEKIWKSTERELLEILDSDFLKPRSKEVRFYAPSFTYYKTKYYSSSPNEFPTISVTGGSCSLNCKHCGGKILETMHPADSPQKLYETCLRLKQGGAKGCLISGGCLSDGTVPLDDFVETIAKIKHELELTVFVHTGIIKEKTAGSLKKAGVDAALIDILGSQDTIERTLNLNVAVQDYADSLEALEKAGLNFVPHVIVGLNDSKLDGELRALEMIGKVKPSALVIIAFMPIRGTVMAKTSSPKPLIIAKVVAEARLRFPLTPLILGCMRPKDPDRGQTDVLALKAGVDAIAFPSEEAINFARRKGYSISFSSHCCAQMYQDFAEIKL